MKYDKWATQKEKLVADFREHMHSEYGGEHPLTDQMWNAWQWSALRALETASTIARSTYEGCTQSGEEGDSGFDFMGENTAYALDDLASAIHADVTKER